MMLATTSKRWGILKSLVRMAFFRAGREDIQSRVSAPFSRLTMNSVQSSQARPSYQTHWKLSAVDTGEKGEDQKLGSQSVFDGTLCPDTRRRLPRGRSSHQWLTPPTRHAPEHPLPYPMLLLLDEDRCSSDPAMPSKLFWRCLHPKCKETAAPCRLPPQTLHRTSRVILSSWNSETESGHTSHSGWWTETANKLDAHRPRGIYGANYNY